MRRVEDYVTTYISMYIYIYSQITYVYTYLFMCIFMNMNKRSLCGGSKAMSKHRYPCMCTYIHKLHGCIRVYLCVYFTYIHVHFYEYE